jgi:hypothetical protein
MEKDYSNWSQPLDTLLILIKLIGRQASSKSATAIIRLPGGLQYHKKSLELRMETLDHGWSRSSPVPHRGWRGYNLPSSRPKGILLLLKTVNWQASQKSATALIRLSDAPQ